VSETFLLGGSFDPIHEGHLALARTLLEKKSPKKILFVPAQQNPLKTSAPASAEHRANMVRLALEEAGEPRLQYWGGELARPGPSYTIDTLRELSGQGEKELVLVMGNEVYAHLEKWREPEGIRKLARLLVIQREPTSPPLKAADSVEYLHFPVVPVSATALRQEIARRWQSGDLDSKPRGIGHSVWQYIKENRLYAVRGE